MLPENHGLRPIKHLNFLRPHETPRSMETGEFLYHIRTHLRSPYTGLTVWASKLAEEHCKARYMPMLGTLVLYTATNREFDRPFPIWHGLPYFPMNAGAAWLEKEDGGRWEYSSEAPIPGWRSLLESFVKRSIIRPSDRITYLICRDSFELARNSERPYR